MVRAYILIEMAAGHSTKLVRTLRGQPGVKDVDRVTGPYDVIAIIEASDLNKAHEFVTTEIHRLEGVLRTITSVSVQ